MNNAVQKICELVGEQDSMRLNADIDELTERYKPMVRDVLIVVSNPDTPEQLVNAMHDELQFQTRELLGRLNVELPTRMGNLKSTSPFLFPLFSIPTKSG